MECMISRRRRFPNEHLALNLSHKFGFKDSKILGPGWLPKLLVLWHYRRRKDLFRSGPQYISWPRRLAASVSLGESLHEVVFSSSFARRGEKLPIFLTLQFYCTFHQKWLMNQLQSCLVCWEGHLPAFLYIIDFWYAPSYPYPPHDSHKLFPFAKSK